MRAQADLNIPPRLMPLAATAIAIALILAPALRASTLTVVGTTLFYTQGSNINHVLTVSGNASTGVWTFTDNENITSAPIGWVGTGTMTVTGTNPGLAPFNSVSITTGSGDDTVNIQAIANPTTVNTGSGNDAINVSSDAPTNTGNLAGIAGTLTIDAAAGSNMLNVSESGSATANEVMHVTGSQISSTVVPFTINYSASGGTFGAISLSSSGNVSLDGGLSASGTVTVTSTNGSISGPGAIMATNLALSAITGIGTSGAPINTTVANLEGQSSTGGVFINNMGNLAIGGVSGSISGLQATTSGDVRLINQGSIYVIVTDDVISAPGNVMVQALGATSDIRTGGQFAFDAIRSTAGNVSVQAGRNLSMGNDIDTGDIGTTSGATSVSAGRSLYVDFGSRLSASGGSDLTASAGLDILVDSTFGITNARIINFGSGAITLTTGAGGLFLASSGNVAGDVQGRGGAITINADDVQLIDTNSIAAGAGIVTIQQVSTNRMIDLGTVSPGNLGLTSDQLTHVTTTNPAGLRIGNAGAAFVGGINVTAPITGSANYGNTLSLRSGGGPFSASGGSLAVTNLLLTDGAATGHTWTINPSSVTESPNSAIPYSSTTNLTVNGGTGSDTFNVTPSSATTFNINGNDPTPPALPGDALNVSIGGTISPSLSVTNTPSGFQGSFTFGGNTRPVNFSQIESGIASPPTISKAFAAATIPVSGTTSLTFSIQNPNTDVTLTGIAFTDSLPAGLQVAPTPNLSNTCGGIATAVAGSGSVSLSGGTRAASAGCTVLLSVQGTTAGVKNNSVTVTSTEGGQGNTSSTSVTVFASADLAVTKSGPASVVAGNNISYIVAVTNNGPSDAQSVNLSDTLPTGTTFVSEGQTAGPSFTCTNPTVGGTGSVGCTISTLANGASATFTLVFKVGASVASGSTITNTASVSSSTSDPTPSNNSRSTSAAVSTSADLAVTKSGPASIVAGNNISYSLTVTNNGPSDAQTVSLTDALPANTTFVFESQTSGPAFTCSTPTVGGTGTITCNIATLVSGATANFSLVFRTASSIANNSALSNTAAITSATTDPNNANNSSTATTTANAQADLSVTKSGPGSTNPGTNVTYTVVVVNNGPSDAASVSLTDTLPAGTTFVSESQTAGPAFTCAKPAVGGTGTVTCSIATLGSGASASFTVVLQTSTANFSNTATVSSSTIDPNPANNSSTSTTGIITADVSIAKTASAPLPFGGQNITYTLMVANAGPATATSVSVTDVLPVGSTLISATPQGACSGTATITCQVAALSNGASMTITLVVTAPYTGGSLVNTATVTAAQADPNPTNNSSTATLSIQPASAIPALSNTLLLLLCAMLALIAALKLR